MQDKLANAGALAELCRLELRRFGLTQSPARLRRPSLPPGKRLNRTLEELEAHALLADVSRPVDGLEASDPRLQVVGLAETGIHERLMSFRNRLVTASDGDQR
jgi:hypothetical protein